MRIGEGDHKFMSQLHYLEKWFVYRCHLKMYTVSQSMHSSEQNLIGILCLTLVMLCIFHFRTSCSCVGATEGYHSHWSIYKCAQQAERPFCLCNLSTSFTNYNNKHYAPCPKLSVSTLIEP